MPNWITNTIQAEPNVIKKIARICCVDGIFDFNTLIPMPQSIKETTSGSQNDYDIYYYLSKRLTIPLEEVRKNKYSKLIHNQFSKDWIQEIYISFQNKEIVENASFERGERLVSNFQKYQAINWYDWAWANWDTKWNACDTAIYNAGICFDTAWATPTAIFEELCQRFPNEKIEFISEDEEGHVDIYENQNGIYTYVNSYDDYPDDYDEEEEIC